MNEDIKRLLTIIKRAPTPFGKTDSELAQEYRNWFLGSRLNLKAAEQSFVPDPETGVAKSDNETVRLLAPRNYVTKYFSNDL